MLNVVKLENQSLTTKEKDFITKMATDFINSYSCNGQLRIEQEEDQEELAEEIKICKSLIEKLGMGE